MSSQTSSRQSTLLQSLQPNSLYILLYLHPNPTIKFHWGLYHHLSSSAGGWKFDIINPGGIWRLAVSYTGPKSPRTDVLDPHVREPLACCVRVAAPWLEKGKVGVEVLHEVTREEDGRLNQINEELKDALSCRMYVKRALERLKGRALVEYQAWEELETTVLEVGEKCRELGAGGEILVVDHKEVT